MKYKVRFCALEQRALVPEGGVFGKAILAICSAVNEINVPFLLTSKAAHEVNVNVTSLSAHD